MERLPAIEVAEFNFATETIQTPWEGMTFPEDDTTAELFVKVISLYNYGGVYLVYEYRFKNN